MDQIDELLTRGIANIIPSKEELKKQLNQGKKLNIYLGIDPTATNIHLGHGVILRILQKFSDLGHNVTFLIGDFTALVGDTSDKDTERPMLSKEKIEENFHTYKKQAEKILDFSKVKIRYNSEWLDKLNLRDFLKISNIFSINDFISRELIKKRLTDGKRIGLTESFYPLLQAYDSYTLKTDIQIGGTDQTFNMQSGRTLIKTLDDRESFVISTPFLMGTDGRKMSKSWGNAIWLDDDPFTMYRKVMSVTDSEIINYFVLATNLAMDKIPSEKEIYENPMEIKKKLALQIVGDLHGKEEAEKAAEEFKKVVQEKQAPADILIANVNKETLIDENLLVELGFANSKSEAKRLFEQNAVSLGGQKIKSGEEMADEEEVVLSVGKKMIKLNPNG